ncbi:hypothetical protein [sulfur-oxidizing endosymbiont of Gigantopelta aegis]|uniref:hypothetical protein n=1 Tax=sulfur-oxidizing endosymbiont of Gigantopelta aegis TaxID=2794934 RepID=UPI0018DB5E79|nr:hypothetical protein [sulfur-oxidizing endosymbiont of Gigantopelta aegis]
MESMESKEQCLSNVSSNAMIDAFNSEHDDVIDVVGKQEVTITPVRKTKAATKSKVAKKKPVAKKTVAKKTIAKKVVAKKPAAKKTVAKKSPLKKVAAKAKASVKKDVAEKKPALADAVEK